MLNKFNQIGLALVFVTIVLYGGWQISKEAIFWNLRLSNNFVTCSNEKEQLKKELAEARKK